MTCTPNTTSDYEVFNASFDNSKVFVTTNGGNSLDYKHTEELLYHHVLPVLCCFGILGNILNLVILSRKSLTIHMERLEKCAHGHLVALAVSDLMYCITALPRTAMASYVHTSYISPWLLYDTYHGAVINTFLLCSSWLTVAMAVSRYIAICYPVKARQHLGITSTRMVIAGIFIMSVLFNLPRYFTKSIHHISCEEGGYLYFTFSGPLLVQPHAEDIYLWTYFVSGIMIPLVAMVYCTIYFIRALQSSKKLHQNHSTRHRNSTSSSSSTSGSPNILTLTLSIIVVLYILLVTPAEIMTFFKSSVWKHYKSHSDILARYSLGLAVCNILQTLNFAVNFLLYCMINVHFRRVIRNLICRHSERSRHGRPFSCSDRSSMLNNNTAVSIL